MLFKIIVLLGLLGRISGHTWIEQLSLVDQNDQPTGDPGFIRGYGQWRDHLPALPID
jgi:hypothetical protein